MDIRGYLTGSKKEKGLGDWATTSNIYDLKYISYHIIPYQTSPLG